MFIQKQLNFIVFYFSNKISIKMCILKRNFESAISVHTENYHCNNNKVHFVGAILLHITNRCVTNTICFFKWTICILLDLFVDRTKRFVILTTDIVIVIFFKKTTLLLKQIQFCFNDLLHSQLILLHTQLILPPLIDTFSLGTFKENIIRSTQPY